MNARRGRNVYDEDLDQRRCTADAKARLREGAEPGSDEARCRNRPVPGGYTCRMHGSATKAARESGLQRLAALVDPSIGALAEIVQGETAEWTMLERGESGVGVWKRVGYDPNTKRKAAEAILDRTGYPRRTEIDLGESREAILERLRALRDHANGAT